MGVGGLRSTTFVAIYINMFVLTLSFQIKLCHLGKPCITPVHKRAANGENRLWDKNAC